MDPGLIGWLNFILLNIFGISATYLYVLSVMPAHREERVGPKAWEDCKKFRILSGIFLYLMVLNYLLWYFFPIPGLNWIISLNWWIPFTIGLVGLILGLILMFKGVKDAGKETIQPSKDTKLYRGIYRYIRHPQMLGEMPLFIVFALWINSLFMLVFSIFLVIIISAIMIHYEEKDLIKRFGNEYLQYRKQTGAIFPKLRHKKSE